MMCNEEIYKIKYKNIWNECLLCEINKYKNLL